MLAAVLLIVVGLSAGTEAVTTMVLGSTHKSGTYFNDAWRRASAHLPCVAQELTVVSDNQYHTPVRPENKYVMLARDPISMVISGYHYHMNGQEPHVITKSKPYLYAIVEKSLKYGLPTPKSGETYYKYLRRLNETQGITAHMIRTNRIDLGSDVLMSRHRNDSNVMFMCTESLPSRLVDQRDVYFDMAIFAGLPADCASRLASKAVLEATSKIAGHTTDHSDDARLRGVVEDIDRRLFGSAFTRAAAIVHCG